ncbi:Aerotolerance protein BatB / Aerotolerance protein BatC [hydrothermal vent metagenome]|uniref:Aerotolerance protein BatB / Aerotolerance protein BatC n=1 Tax=hydrothermal vent metagenome TaxID=652676 RepID=A0A3B0VQI1_9ZZZZ
MNELMNLQFLRPYWLLALLPIAWLLWKLWQIKQKQGAWHQVIAPLFRPLLLRENANQSGTRTHQLGLLGLGFIWIIATLALAGPSTKSVEMPAQKNQQGSVIVLDLSLSMLADDLSPNRLARVKYKITDLLTQHPELAIGLVGYAGSAHTISPISEDNQTLLSLLPALNPVLMPRYGAEPLLGFQKADELFQGAHINHGHIIWITDDIEPHQVTQLKQWIQQHDYSVSILTVGTATGGAVQIPNYGLLKDDNGKIISPPLPLKRFNAFTELSQVTLSHLNISDQSLDALLPPTLPAVNTTKPGEHSDTQLVLPLDQGIYLLLLLIPLVTLLFRRGWLLSLSALSLPLVGLLSASLFSIGLFTPNSSYAEESLPSISDVFKTPDQLGYQAWQENNLQAAESLFEDPQWRATSLYKLGKYQEAAELFRQDKSATGYYNLGNALAKNGELEAAKEAYETALKQQPNLTKAQQNLSIIEQLLAQQQTEDSAQQNQNQASQKEDSSSESQSDSESSEASEKANDHKNSSDEAENNREEDSKKGNSSEDPSNEQNEKSSNQMADSDLKNEAVPQPSSEQKKEGEGNAHEKESKEKNSAIQDSESSEAHQEQAERNDGKLSDRLENQPTNLQEANTQLTPKEQEQQQAMKNWLKQIPDEPGLFLKRKFEYQYQQQSNQSESVQDSKPW